MDRGARQGGNVYRRTDSEEGVDSKRQEAGSEDQQSGDAPEESGTASDWEAS